MWVFPAEPVVWQPLACVQLALPLEEVGTLHLGATRDWGQGWYS